MQSNFFLDYSYDLGKAKDVENLLSTAKPDDKNNGLVIAAEAGNYFEVVLI